MTVATEEKRYSASGALAWTYSGMLVKIACQFGIGIAIARMLGPEPYGLVATSAIVMSLCILLVDGGISASLIHHQIVSDQEIAGAFWIQFGLACLISVIIISVAPVFVQWLKVAEAEIILQVTALAFPLSAIASISTALLRRRLNMRIIQISMICSYLIAYGIVGIGLAINGYGVWALVLSQIAQTGINAIILFIAVRPPLRHPVWPRRMLSFGGWAVLSNITAWAHGNLMNIILARVFGVAALGQFNRLELITKSTVPLIGGPIQQVLFPALSRSMDDLRHCQRVVRSVFRLIGLVFFPAMLIMFIFPEQVVAGVFGEKFIGNADILAPLALTTIGAIWTATVSSIFFGHGKPRVQWIVQTVTLPLTLLILWYFSHDTLVVLVWGFCLSTWIRAIANLVAAVWAEVLVVSDVVVGFAPAILPALLGVGGAWVGFTNTDSHSPEYQLLVAGTLAVVGWGFCIILLWKWVIPASVRKRIEVLRSRVALNINAFF